MQFTTIVVSAAIAASGLSQPALAGVERQVRVEYQDLDLSQPRDADLMLARLTHAANRVCGGRPNADPNYRHARTQVRAAFEACVSEALSTAVARLDSPLVERAYAAASQRPLG